MSFRESFIKGFDWTGRDAGHDGAGGDIACDDGTGGDDGTIADGHAGKNARTRADPDARTDSHGRGDEVAATLFLENAVMERGILYVVTELNKSAYSHSQPQEGSPWYYELEVDGTTRTFKYGARASNPVDQWPTPDVYTHSSGQQLSSSEVRNINRAYPGSETGTPEERPRDLEPPRQYSQFFY